MSEEPQIETASAARNNARMAEIIDPGFDHRRLQPSQFPDYPNYDQYYFYYPYPPEEQKFIGIIPWALRIIKICTIGLVLLSSSATLYGIFYWAVMPGTFASRSLYFDYTGILPFPHQNVTSIHTTEISTRIQPDSLATSSQSQSTRDDSYVYSPWASVDLFSIEQSVSFSETPHAELIPPSNIQNRFLQPNQRYYVEVFLTLPESNHNQNIGMFGVAVELISNQNNNNGIVLNLASSVRPARLPFESGWLQIVRKLVWVVPLVFGGVQESKTIQIMAFRHVIESQEYPLRHVVARLVSQVSPVNGFSKIPEVIFGEVRIGKELKNWQQILKDWFYTCYFIGTCLLFGAHLWCWIVFQYYWGENNADEFEPYFDPSCDYDGGQDDGFASISSSRSENMNDYASAASNEERWEHGDGYGYDSLDDGSENWEECPARDEDMSIERDQPSRGGVSSPSRIDRRTRPRHAEVGMTGSRYSLSSSRQPISTVSDSGTNEPEHLADLSYSASISQLENLDERRGRSNNVNMDEAGEATTTPAYIGGSSSQINFVDMDTLNADNNTQDGEPHRDRPSASTRDKAISQNQCGDDECSDIPLVGLERTRIPDEANADDEGISSYLPSAHLEGIALPDEPLSLLETNDLPNRKISDGQGIRRSIPDKPYTSPESGGNKAETKAPRVPTHFEEEKKTTEEDNQDDSADKLKITAEGFAELTDANNFTPIEDCEEDTRGDQETDLELKCDRSERTAEASTKLEAPSILPEASGSCDSSSLAEPCPSEFVLSLSEVASRVSTREVERDSSRGQEKIQVEPDCSAKISRSSGSMLESHTPLEVTGGVSKTVERIRSMDVGEVQLEAESAVTDLRSSSNTPDSVASKADDLISTTRDDDVCEDEGEEEVELEVKNIIFQVPEAQILDSFLCDLINPFVR